MINKDIYKRLTVCVDSHLLDNGEESKEYGLSPDIKFNEFSCMDIPNAVYNKLGELEDKIMDGTLIFKESEDDKTREK